MQDFSDSSSDLDRARSFGVYVHGAAKFEKVGDEEEVEIFL